MRKWSEIKNIEKVKEYLEFLEQKGEKIYYINDFPWVKYRGILQPAIPIPHEPPRFSLQDIKGLLKLSKLSFIRWSSGFRNSSTEWWWIVSDRPIRLETLTGNTRSKVKRGMKRCKVKIITTDWLSENGYECYRSAFRRYKNVKPSDKNLFQQDIRSKKGYSCFKFWGVFFKEKLIGYTECIIINNTIATSTIKYHPDYLKYYSAYTLMYSILDYYLNQKKYNSISNGTRSIAHDTQMQEFLIKKFNFKKKFCKINVVYSPLFGFLVKTAYWLKSIINILNQLIPNIIFQKIVILIKQEEIRRSFL